MTTQNEVYIVITKGDGVQDIELLDQPPRWVRVLDQRLRTACVNGGDSLEIDWPTFSKDDLLVMCRRGGYLGRDEAAVWDEVGFVYGGNYGACLGFIHGYNARGRVA